MGEADNLMKSAMGEADNLMKSAMGEAENLIESARTEAENLIESAMGEVRGLKESTVIEINNVRESARVEVENLKESARIAAENLRKTARITAENLRKTARITAENLKETANVESENLRKTARITTENLMESARIAAENLRKTARITAENLMESARIAAENLRKTARITAENLMESARIHSPQSLTNTHEELERLKKIRESKREKNLRFQKEHVLTMVLIAVTISAAFGGYSYYENQIVTNNMSQMLKNYKTNYMIQNLQGDVVNTWVAWSIPNNRILHINVVNTANLSQDKLDAIKDAILSTKTVAIDDALMHKGPAGTSSVYYVGWEGALTRAYSQPTTSYIPQKFDISESPSESGDIVIILTNDVNPDGISGYTKSIVDGNQILKSKTTIYGASQLDVNQLEAITRHEFGHAMGLAHSTAPEDLMYATIQTDYPYISGCDIDAIKGLYNGNEYSQVICKK